jgi:hypothetical protein
MKINTSTFIPSLANTSAANKENLTILAKAQIVISVPAL